MNKCPSWETDELDDGGVVYQYRYERPQGKPPAGQISFPSFGGIQLLYMSEAKERDLLQNKLHSIRKKTPKLLPWWEHVGFTSAQGGTDSEQTNYDELWQAACLAARAHDLAEGSEHPDKENAKRAIHLLQVFASDAVAHFDISKLSLLTSIMETAQWREKDNVRDQDDEKEWGGEKTWQKSSGGAVLSALETAALTAHKERGEPPTKGEVARACNSKRISEKRVRQILDDYGFWWLPEATRGRKPIRKS